MGLGTGALDELGEDEHAKEEDRSKDRKDGAGDRVLGADVGPVILKTGTANSSPLLLAADGIVLDKNVVSQSIGEEPSTAYLDPVDEFSCGNVRLVAESMVGLEGAIGAVLKLDPDEVAIFGGRSATELESKSRGVVGCMSTSMDAVRSSKIIRTDTSKFGVLLGHLEHVEQGNERLVGGLDEEELESVTVECNAREGAQDRVEDCAASH